MLLGKTEAKWPTNNPDLEGRIIFKRIFKKWVAGHDVAKDYDKHDVAKDYDKRDMAKDYDKHDMAKDYDNWWLLLNGAKNHVRP